MDGGLRQEIATKGYAIVEGVLDSEALNDIVADYEGLLDRLGAGMARAGAHLVGI